MSERTGPPDAAPDAGAPWFDTQTQGRMPWRDGDVVISVPVKSGTTWMMNIVHQLRTGGDADFSDIYLEVPWLEFVERPGQTPEERMARWAAMARSEPRVFKSHAGPPTLPYVDPEPGSAQVKYVVVVRSPDEAVASLRPFLARHSQAFFDLWGIPKQSMLFPSFEAYFEGFIEGAGIGGAPFAFTAGWWPLRDRPNVLMVHFAELKRAPEATIRRVAAFLGYAPTAAQWPVILEHCSFQWMKAHQSKFELRDVGAVPVLEPGGMIRKGKLGAAGEDGMTDALCGRLRAMGEAILQDGEALDWVYNGPPVDL